jgi:TrmH family RNA methyltransferase
MSRRRRIASRDNAHFKQLRDLSEDPREVRRLGLTIADGIHLVSTCVDRGVGIQELIVSDSAEHNQEIQLLLSNAECDVLELPDSLFKAISGVASPTGIAAVISVPQQGNAKLLGDLVMLDAVQDAGNIGTILRTAAAAGVSTVVLGEGCAGAWTPRVLRAGQGAHFSLHIVEQVELPSLLESLDIASYAAVARDGANLYATDLRAPCCWLFGNEGAGLSLSVLERVRHRVTIPMAATTESLNVAAAAAVCLFEMQRQRRPTRADF